LIERKGHHIAIEALAEVPDALLLIVGDGPLEQSLRQLAKRVGVTGRVRFLGHVEHDDLAVYYAAADALVLASASEGMPNVMLEAMACGTPVIATSVGGIPEILRPPKGGELMTERSPNTMVEAWKRIRSRGLSRGRRDAVRHYVEAFSWAETSKGQLEVFSRILGRDMEAVQPQQEDAPLSGRHGSSTRQLNG
jgi:glycosyltransferase involved in cell wall biosynthesis